MDEDREIAAAFATGLEPIMDQTPAIPEWESLQFESGPSASGWGQWWMAAVAAAVVLVVGAGSFLLLRTAGGGSGGTDEGPRGVAGQDGNDGETAAGLSLDGIWILESWEESGEQVMVEVGENTPDEPWLEFTQSFEGERDSFISADGSGTAGTFVGWTGCNLIEPTEYEDSGGFLTHGEIVVQAGGCESGRAGEVFLATLMNTPDGIEVIMGPDRMEWHGSNLEGISYPLVFRRDGTPAPDPAGTTTTTAPAGADAPVFAVFDVDGVEVVTPTRLGELPDQAVHVEFTTTVIDSGEGPTLCLGGVMESLPPQCSGPIAVGLDMDGWSQEANGVRWGEQTVTVTWPPLVDLVEVISQSDPVRWDVEYPPGRLPEECHGIGAMAGAGPINELASSLGDQNGGIYLANDGTIVLQVVGDPTPHREALAELGGACVIEVSRSEAEQRAVQDMIIPRLADVPGVGMTYSVSSGPGGRVEIHVPVADVATARAVAALVEDPTTIRLVGMGILSR